MTGEIMFEMPTVISQMIGVNVQNICSYVECFEKKKDLNDE